MDCLPQQRALKPHSRLPACVCVPSFREDDIQLAEPSDEERLGLRLSADREDPLHDGAEDGGEISKCNLVND